MISGFAEFFRVMGDLGAQLILVPAAFNMTTGPLHWDLAFRMRALDQQCFVAGCSPARDRSASYVAYGHSLVCNPWGEILTDCGEGEAVRVVDLDLGRPGPLPGPRFPFSLAAGPICTARSNKHNGPVGAPQTKKGMLPCIITVIKIMPPVSLESWCWRWR